MLTGKRQGGLSEPFSSLLVTGLSPGLRSYTTVGATLTPSAGGMYHGVPRVVYIPGCTSVVYIPGCTSVGVLCLPGTSVGVLCLPGTPRGYPPCTASTPVGILHAPLVHPWVLPTTVGTPVGPPYRRGYTRMCPVLHRFEHKCVPFCTVLHIKQA